jgi:hypothetical protein
MGQGMRRCSKCGMEKPDDLFYVRKGKREAVCIECRKKIERDRYTTQKSEIDARNKKWRDEHPGIYRAGKRSYYLENKDHVIRKSIEWAKANPEKVRTKNVRWKQNNPERLRRHRIGAKMRLHGGTIGDYDRIFEDQAGVCAICHSAVDLVVDHDHVTNMYRGLLCNECNGLLGFAKESKEILLRAIEYLSTHKKREP